jgi:ATP-dependent RNA helicase DeaD
MTIERDVTVDSFNDLRLRPTTGQALAQMGITTPTPIQAEALPLLLAGRDVIGQARTGSGKTLAFGIPASELVDPRQRAVQVLVLTPTRELAVQVGGVLDAVGASRGVVTTLIFGGRAAGPQIAALRRGAHIVVGTPGRVLDLLNQGALDLRAIRFLVLDEADEMLDRGFAPDVERILARTPRERQSALFSATVPGWVDEMAHKHLRNPHTVRVDPNPEDVAPIDHIAWDLPDDDKLSVLRDLLDRRGDGSIIVFGRTKHGVKKLARKLEMEGYPVAALQGNLSQNARDRVMEDFRSGRVQILLATNVAARGLDISSIDQVINVDLPESPELLTHRIGRTGRMGRKGQAITLLAPEDNAKWRQLERGLQRRIPRAPWPGADAAIAADPADYVVSEQRPARRPTAGPAQRVERTERPVASRRPRPETAITLPVSTQPREQGMHRSRRGGQSARASHTITCSGCGRPSTVSFRPDPARPVYCSDCFRPRGAR